MHPVLKDRYSRPTVLALCSVATLLFGALTVFFGEFFLVLTVPFLSAVFLYENKEKRILSYLLPFALILLDVLINRNFAVSSATATLLSVLLVGCLFLRINKGQTAFALVCVLCVSFLLVLLLVAFQNENTKSVADVFPYYQNILADLKERTTDELLDAYDAVRDNFPKSYATLFTEENIGKMFDSLVALLPSVLVLSMFFAAGILLKVFCLLICLLSKEEKILRTWRFSTSNLFVIVFFLTSLLSLFFSTDTVFGTSVLNIYYIFVGVYAYLGLKFFCMVVRRSKRKAFPILLFVATVLVLNVVAVVPLSYFGAFFTMLSNRYAAFLHDRGPDDRNDF